MKAELSLVHFQLTSRCNLHCPFCGQWGIDGFRKKESPAELPFNIWRRAADSIVQYCRHSGLALPDICIWGGEPLLHPDFGTIAAYLHSCGFRLGVVTNGFLLQEQIANINNYFSTVYISIDGPGRVHDRIRGSRGLWNRISSGLALINDSINVVAMCAITGSSIATLEELPFAVGDLNVDSLLLQNLIFLDSDDVENIKSWLQCEFQQPGHHIDSWVDSTAKTWLKCLPDILGRVEEKIRKGAYPVRTEIRPGEINSGNVLEWYCNPDSIRAFRNDGNHCLSPGRHLSVMADGRVTPCVDFDDFSAGNILEEELMKIYDNEIMLRYWDMVNKGCNRFCRRCPWRFNSEFKLDTKK